MMAINNLVFLLPKRSNKATADDVLKQLECQIQILLEANRTQKHFERSLGIQLANCLFYSENDKFLLHKR
jgi:hypothetical protein